MTRDNFKKIIKLRSIWKIDKRKGNYRLPNGDLLSSYVEKLVDEQMKLDTLGIKSDGNLCFCTGGDWNIDAKEFNDFTLMPAFKPNETCTFEEMESRVKTLVREIIS